MTRRRNTAENIGLRMPMSDETLAWIERHFPSLYEKIMEAQD